MIWIIVGVLILAGIGSTAYFLTRNGDKVSDATQTEKVSSGDVKEESATVTDAEGVSASEASDSTSVAEESDDAEPEEGKDQDSKESSRPHSNDKKRSSGKPDHKSNSKHSGERSSKGDLGGSTPSEAERQRGRNAYERYRR